MTLDAHAVAARTLEAVESGGSAVGVLAVQADAPEVPGARLLVIRDPEGVDTVHGSLGSELLDTLAVSLASAALGDPGSADGLRTLPVGDGAVEVYLEIRRPVQDLVIVGAGHIARPMAAMGAMLGFRVWVLDDRPDFATQERFPDAFRVVRADFAEPFRNVPIHGGTHVLLVTRGHRYDYDCLVRILREPAVPAYIGMIGSQRRVRATFHQLLEDGLPRYRLDEIHAPVGLDIGAETPEEIAVAVAAELVKARRGGSGTSLRDLQRVAERFFTPGSGTPTSDQEAT
jgi:xanthine dehydrogenase accessory factor